ncbi:hypothetical protein TpMuguga_03g00559 [Theileria parva strain Muguga]|uniref:Uncharacterized protein n=1 Tax=Theileria parva TaxID=5875 RepID=Q4MZG1_THEPA|nr:uncharacterized protein TpMuguga_03g00559 [Theileria parva strain Muguga]EAN31304.1 hypothetical protein TpMuguga_03g00559 [Theileria parva strain Muguga]|eukprot:XP_763587.1 hypothetical protein [Theileria parva strain Muguga]
MLSNDTFLARIDSEIKEKKFYESMQHILTLIKRLAMRKKYDESLEILYKYSLIYLDEKEYILAGELMDEYTKLCETYNIPLNTNIVNQLVTVFQFPYSHITYSNTNNSGANNVDTNTASPKSTNENTNNIIDKNKLEEIMLLYVKYMNRAILYSKSVEEPNGNPILHRVLGVYYFHVNEYSKAQGNLIYSQDVELLLKVVNEWKAESDEDDGDFFYLRAVLMLLAVGDVCNAKCFLYLLDYNLEDHELPIPIQFGNVLSESCEIRNFELFKEACETYKDLIELDSEYPHLLNRIKEIYFKDNPDPFNSDNNFESTISNLLQSLI